MVQGRAVVKTTRPFVGPDTVSQVGPCSPSLLFVRHTGKQRAPSADQGGSRHLAAGLERGLQDGPGIKAPRHAVLRWIGAGQSRDARLDCLCWSAGLLDSMSGRRPLRAH